jgi:hypothetical protein
MLSQAVGRVKDVLSRRQESADVFERAVLNLLAFDNPSKVDKVRFRRRLGQAPAEDHILSN